jgi:outer membrane protein OmpA-like peptidoglycan-associated protein
MRKLMVLIMLFMAGSQLVYSQDYRKEADKCLVTGDYDCVKRNLQLYQEDERGDVSRQLQDAEDCMKARTLADYLFEEKEYEKAAQQYEKILKLNPKDRYAKKQYDESVLRLMPAKRDEYPDAIFFTVGSAEVHDSQLVYLARIAESLVANPNKNLNLSGYASDADGDAGQGLSRGRAVSVAKILMDKFNIDANRISFEWRGDRPFAEDNYNRVVFLKIK